jgi:DNA-binding transcriptional regulator YdaS (Cro superfamily)
LSDDLLTKKAFAALVNVSQSRVSQWVASGIRQRIGQVKADQKSRGRYQGGTIPFG